MSDSDEILTKKLRPVLLELFLDGLNELSGAAQQQVVGGVNAGRIALKFETTLDTDHVPLVRCIACGRREPRGEDVVLFSRGGELADAPGPVN